LNDSTFRSSLLRRNLTTPKPPGEQPKNLELLARERHVNGGLWRHHPLAAAPIRMASQLEPIPQSLPLGGLADEAAMQFLCEDLDLAGQLGVGFELQLLRYKVVIGFGLLEGGLAILADHDERRQEDRFE
jgi:hypothetical protein